MQRAIRLQHRGVVEASGLVFNPSLIGTRRARERALALWTHGAAAYNYNGLLILQLPSPVVVDCALAPGTPLVPTGNVTASLPIAGSAAHEQHWASGSVVLSIGGTVTAVARSAMEPVDPASWINTDELLLADVHPLAEQPIPPRTQIPPLKLDARARLAKITWEPPGRKRLLTSLANGTGRVASDSAATLKHTAGALIQRGITWAKRLRGRAGRPNAASGNVMRSGNGRTQMGSGRQARPRRPGILDRLEQWSRKLLWQSKLASSFDRENAEYLEEMLRMFQTGNIMEALRRAIPLNDSGNFKQQLPKFGPIRNNNDLQLRPERGHTSGNVGLEDELFATLRKHYEESARQLEKDGRIEEAAYVLADLLNSPQRAVDLLERHNHVRTAAEISEARDLPAGQTVRLWFMTGEMDRAIALAIRSGSFAQTISALENRNLHDKARELRLRWITLLADSGNYTAAVDTVWPLEDERARAIPWLDALIDLGGTTGARMLARRIVVAGDEAPAFRQQALLLLNGRDPQDAPQRSAFSEELAQLGDPSSKALGRVAIRTLVRDGADTGAAGMVNALHRYTNNLALRTDSRSLVAMQPAAKPGTTCELTVESVDRGARTAHDVALLANGRLVAALGEAGVLMLNRTGNVIAHLNQPAYRLVIADGGEHGIGIAPRDGVARLCKLDFAARHAEPWCEAEITVWADTYDGLIWLAATRGLVHAVNTTESTLASLWHWNDERLIPLALARHEGNGSFLMAPAADPSGMQHAWEAWSVDLRSLTVRNRQALPKSTGHFVFAPVIAPDARTVRLIFDHRDHDHGIPPCTSIAIGDSLVQFEALPSAPTVATTNGFTSVAMVQQSGVEVRIYRDRSVQAAATITLLGAGLARTRLNERTAVITDDLGRIIVVDLARMEITHNTRLR